MRFFILLIKIIVFVWLVVLSLDLFGQNNYLDSVKCKLENDSIRIFKLKKYLPILIFDSRNSFISNASVNIIGFQVGILFNERDIAGVGGYKIYLPYKLIDNNELYKLRVQYLTGFYRKVIVFKRFYEFDLMGEVGIGKFNIHKILKEKEIFVKRGDFNSLGLSFVGIVKPLRWMGFETMLGYQWMLQKQYYSTFSGWFYSVGLWFSVRDFVRFIQYNCIAKRRYKKCIRQYDTTNAK
ncbi:MAG: hypothetical protein KatS3mg027_2124 [Bacteroidia bacterium]|nr:MAG: hypothetical protein KatS3mg027_2124 [Bacteroidia bacterium]